MLQGVELVSSSEIGNRLGLSAHSVRKDFSYLPEIGSTGARYNVRFLREHIGNALDLTHKRNACIVGLGRLGSAILNYKNFEENGYEIVAGFDSNVNIVETTKTSIDLYPAYRIPEIVKSKDIELAVIAVPAESAQKTAVRLIEGGIKGIVNFAPTHIINSKSNVFIKNIDVVKEFRVLSAFMGLENKQE